MTSTRTWPGSLAGRCSCGRRKPRLLAGEYDPVTNRPRFRTVGISVARQNGKTTLVLARIGRQLLPRRQTVAYTAQDRSLARTKWLEHVELLMDTPFSARVERVDRSQNREVMVMKNGCSLHAGHPDHEEGRAFAVHRPRHH